MKARNESLSVTSSLIPEGIVMEDWYVNEILPFQTETAKARQAKDEKLTTLIVELDMDHVAMMKKKHSTGSQWVSTNDILQIC